MILDYEQRAIALLESQFQNSPNLHAVVRMIAREIQALEYAIWSVEVERYLGGATGAQLDQWGAIVGAARNGVDDEVYRRVIRARILTNMSTGTIEDLFAIYRELTNDDTASVEVLPPNTLLFSTITGGVLPEYLITLLEKYLRIGKKAGIRLYLVQAEEGYFGFAGNPEALGFDEGKFARLI